MSFKAIKRLDGFTKYEISDDGTVVRHDDGTTIPIIPHKGKSKLGATLTSDDTTTQRTFGLGQLYRLAWNATLPQLQQQYQQGVVSPPKQKKVSRFIAHRRQLVSQHAADEIRKLASLRNKLHGNLNGCELTDGKHTYIYFVLHNVQLKTAIIRIDCRTWRSGYWMYNLDTAQYEKFSPQKHRHDGLLGDSNIIWPKLS